MLALSGFVFSVVWRDITAQDAMGKKQGLKEMGPV